MLYTRFAANVIFPLHELLKGHNTVARRRELERAQWLNADDFRALQEAKLSAFAKRIGANVPAYQKVFADAGLDPNRPLSLDDLTGLPISDKAFVIANTEDLKARDAGPLQRFNTGGSSGEPMVFYLGRERKSHDIASRWRSTRWWDCDIGDREVVLWGSPAELGSQDRIRQVRDFLLRSTLLAAFEMSPANMDRFIEVIRSKRPRMLFGYPSSISLLARHADERGMAMNDLGIRAAFVTSERLYDAQEAQIRSSFNCDVVNGYGGRDSGTISFTCPHGSMHISGEDILVEIIRRDGRVAAPGELGEIVVTHLATPEFPFVRYRTGDMGSLAAEPCACGRALPVLEKLEGRTTDFIVASDGTIMHGLALIYEVRDLPGVRLFKIEQLDLHHTRLLLVTDEHFKPDFEESIRTGFAKRLGDDVRIDIQHVDEIPRERSGKHRYVVSRVEV